MIYSIIQNQGTCFRITCLLGRSTFPRQTGQERILLDFEPDCRIGFTDDDIPLLQFYATNYSDDEPEEFTVNPPNHVICLINWELTSVLLSRVGLNENVVQNPLLPLVELGLDLSLHSFQWQLTSYGCSGTALVYYFQHVTVALMSTPSYVFPRSWNRWREHIEGSKQLLVTFGIHPHVAAHGVTRSQLDQLGSLLVESLHSFQWQLTSYGCSGTALVYYFQHVTVALMSTPS
jgi:hypothetical protein